MVGSDDLIRVSSPITPFFSGTLKSTRMKTRWPLRSRSVMDSFGMVMPGPKRTRPTTFALETLGDELAEQIDAAVRVAPFVVVPGEHLQEVALHHLGVWHVDDRGVRVALEIDRHQLLVRAGEDPLQRAVGRLLQRG